VGYVDRDHAATVEASTVPRRIAWGDDDQDVPHISLDRPQRADTPSDMRPQGSTLQSRAANPVSAPGQAAAVPPASVTSPVHSRHRDGPAGGGREPLREFQRDDRHIPNGGSSPLTQTRQFWVLLGYAAALDDVAHTPADPGPKSSRRSEPTTADRGSRFGEGAGSRFGCEVIGTVAAEPVTDSDTRAREGTKQRLSGKCGGRRRLLHPRRARLSSPSSCAGGPDQVLRR
jgi:hypothetical protein